MILVDSSVWIDFLGGRDESHVRRLRYLLGGTEIAIGDLMVCEVLQGLRDEIEARKVEQFLSRLKIPSMSNAHVAVAAARMYRLLRTRGVTVRKTIDVLIATWCVEHDVPLLHNDRDFTLMAPLIGLREVPPWSH